MAARDPSAGARDLAELWRGLPAAVLRYPARALPPGVGLMALDGTLRARAWREHCASPAASCCADAGVDCILSGSGRCRADALFPERLGGGAPAWRMSTLSIQFRPSVGELWLIALGETAQEEIGWARRCLQERHGMDGAVPLDAACFRDLELRGGPRWRFRFVTPWIVSKERRGGRALEGEEAGVDTPAVARELAKSLTARAHKFTALSARETVWQRVGGHFAHYVADALLPGGFRIENVSITRNPIRLSSAGNAKIFSALTWEGEVTLVISEPLLPWFSLLALCGGGENAGKGFGGVELIPINK